MTVISQRRLRSPHLSYHPYPESPNNPNQLFLRNCPTSSPPDCRMPIQDRTKHLTKTPQILRCNTLLDNDIPHALSSAATVPPPPPASLFAKFTRKYTPPPKSNTTSAPTIAALILHLAHAGYSSPCSCTSWCLSPVCRSFRTDPPSTHAHFARSRPHKSPTSRVIGSV